MKKLISIIVVIFLTSLSLIAQPTPVVPNVNGTLSRSEGEHSEGAPIGTATILLLSLGSGFTGYKLYRNNKDKNKE